ncbi:unnamed protein product [Thelazia callipaeda]|uniref:Phosphoinositide phospholipase C n=1 Tax=Thelazia callipaeda TaxID=103827 RepID=A0A0N5DBN1_THECL|nr:unnamed protein product [Thelazia callipaeda]
MQKATEFIKLRSNTRQFHRTFTLDSDLSHIRWTPTNKKPHKAKIAIESIKEVRVGKNTELFRASETYVNDTQDESAFSIIHGDQYECLDLIAKTPEDAKIWITGLMSLTSKYAGDCESKPSGSQSLATLRERWLQTVFDEADTGKIGYIRENQAVQLIKQLNPRILLSRIKHKVKEVCVLNSKESERGRVTRSQFIEITKAPKNFYFLKICLIILLGVTIDFCKTIIDQYEPCIEARKLNFMTIDGFTNYLNSEENYLFDMTHRKVCQEMNQPFNNYFIATSLNAYPWTDQQKDLSDSNAYTFFLRKNCRFIELNVWEPAENSDEIELMIYNGYGSSKSALPKILNVINQTAFERTRYPLFIRFDIHLSIKWQLVLITMLNNIFGKKLYKPKNDLCDWTKSLQQPTPKDFQMKIILVGKENAEKIDEENEKQNYMTRLNNIPKFTKPMPICEKLSELMCPWIMPVIIKNASSIMQNTLNEKCQLLLLSECDCLRIIQNHPVKISQAAKDYLICVTPNSSNDDTSNLNPQEFWNFGIQMVALNCQTSGLMMDLQEGKFSENGGCGYVLKPSILREECFFTPGDKIPFPPQILHLRILSGQQLPRPRGSTAKGDFTDPYVVIEIYGFSLDYAEERTKTAKNDSNTENLKIIPCANPTFDESFQFQITVPEMALIRFLVLDDDFINDDFIGQYTIPFECMQSGYRHIPLLNREGEVLENCTLFIHVAITNRCGGGVK